MEPNGDSFLNWVLYFLKYPENIFFFTLEGNPQIDTLFIGLPFKAFETTLPLIDNSKRFISCHDEE